MTHDGEGNVTAHQAIMPLKTIIDTTAPSVFPIVVLLPGQRHCIEGAAAIHLPVLMKVSIFIISDLPALPF